MHMTKEAKEFYPILQAFAEGRVIECRTKPSSLKGSDTPNGWTEMKKLDFWPNTEYRIKPKPKYRPFINAEECWQEMQKHQPFGWVKLKGEDTAYGMLTLIKDKVQQLVSTILLFTIAIYFITTLLLIDNHSA